MSEKPSDDQKRETEVLRRMLKTPPKAHKKKAGEPKPTRKKPVNRD